MDRCYFTPLRKAKIQDIGNTKLWQRCGAAVTDSLLMGIHNGAARVEESLPVPYTTKYLPYVDSHAPWHLIKQTEKVCPHTNLHTHL